MVNQRKNIQWWQQNHWKPLIAMVPSKNHYHPIVVKNYHCWSLIWRDRIFGIISREMIKIFDFKNANKYMFVLLSAEKKLCRRWKFNICRQLVSWYLPKFSFLKYLTTILCNLIEKAIHIYVEVIVFWWERKQVKMAFITLMMMVMVVMWMKELNWRCIRLPIVSVTRRYRSEVSYWVSQ